MQKFRIDSVEIVLGPLGLVNFTKMRKKTDCDSDNDEGDGVGDLVV